MTTAPPPLVVTCVLTGAPDEPAMLPTAHPLVVNTPFLDWVAVPATAGGIAQASLTKWQFVAEFGARCSLSQQPADLPAARNLNVFSLCISGAAWTRILTEYVTSGALGIVASNYHEFQEALRALVIINPQELILTPADFLMVEGFTTAVAAAPAIPAVAARRAVAVVLAVAARAAVPATPARREVSALPVMPATQEWLQSPLGVLLPQYPPSQHSQPCRLSRLPGRPPLDPALEFITLAGTLDLEVSGDAPWEVMGYLAGLLGPCLTQAERNRRGSQVQFSARAVAAGAHKRYGTTDGDKYSLAGNLRDFLQSIMRALPSVFLSGRLDAASLRAEGRDAVVYTRGETGRRAVEGSYIYAFGPRWRNRHFP